MGRIGSILAALALLAGSAIAGAADAAPGVTTVILVRHAEAEPAGRDPGLTDSGSARAEALSDALRDTAPDRLYASQFRRTQATLAPLAAARGLEVQVDAVDRQDLPGWAREFANKLLRDHAGGTVVVAGHSNTVPMVIEALGVDRVPEIPHWQHDNLFVVQVDAAGAGLLHLHYGAPSKPGE